MNCAHCNHDYTKVKETRVIPEQPRWSKRRRLCLECGHQFWTVEMPVEDVVVSENDKEKNT